MVKVFMNQLYSGDTNQVQLPYRNDVFADVSPDGDLISFSFSGEHWDNKKARKFLKNRGLNKMITWREHDDGTIVCNHVRLSSSMVSRSVTDTQEILGPDVYGRLMEIESSNGSDKPFLVEFTAMDFNGKDTIEANGFRFYRENTNKDIKKFGGKPIHPGHLGFFEDYKDSIGNTIAPFVNGDGNPSVYGYIYPHGGGKILRDNMKIANAQGILNNYPVSMAGTPIDYTVLTDEERQKAKDSAYIDVQSWEPESMDIVFAGAIPGSEAVSIVNAKNNVFANNKITNRRRVKKLDITMSELIEAMKEFDYIALSDLRQVPAFKKAFDEHVENHIREGLSTDEGIEKAIGIIPEDKLIECSKVKELVDKKVEEFNGDVEVTKDSVEEVAKAAEIELNKVQIWSIRNGINKPLSESEVLERVKQAKELTDLDNIPGFTLAKKEEVKGDDIKCSDTSGGVSTKIISKEERDKIII